MMKKVLKDLACHDVELSILFTGDQEMAGLNSRYRNKSGTTNVLAFPMSNRIIPGADAVMLGDIIVSVDTAILESQKIGEPLHTTIFRLLIHGLLHLVGYDHERSPKAAQQMEKEEKRLFRLIKEE
jgi:rRNA maturation RNase YbeY